MEKSSKTNDGTKKLHKLLKKIADGKKNGMEEFYEVYGDMLLITAMTVCHSREKADEVVNTVLIKIWKLAKTLQDREIGEGWLYVTTVNCAKSKMKGAVWLPLEESVVSPNNEIDELTDRESFLSLIGDLSPIEQELLVYKFVQMMTFEEIAKEMDKPLSTVSSLYYRSLKKIKEKLTK